MISFQTSDELSLVADSAGRFAQEKLRPAGRAAERARAVPQGLRTAFAELGLGLVELPESLGGMALGLGAAALVAESLAVGDLGLAMALPQPGAFGRLLQLLGTPAQQQTWLAAFADQAANTYGAVAFGETVATGSSQSTRALRRGDSYILRGKKEFVLHAGLADRYIILAQLDEKAGLPGAALFIINATTPGLKIETRQSLLGLEVVHGASIVLEDVHLPTSQRLGEGDLTATLDRFFAEEGLINAARAVGLAHASYTYALDYAKERRAFGKPVAHFQSIAFLLADMLMAVDSARLLVRHAAWAAEHHEPDALARLHGARAHADETAFFVTDNAVQILGGHGFVQDHPVEKWMRDAKTLALCYGSRECSDVRAGAAILDTPVSADLLPLGPIQPTWT